MNHDKRVLTDLNQQILIYRDKSALCEGVTGMIKQYAAQTTAESALFHLALAGGSTPRDLYAYLANHSSGFDWSKIHFWFGDERCVPANHADSNFRMINKTLFSKVDIPEKNIHRIHCELSPERAAAAYEQELAKFAEPGERWPRFGLIMLGIGDDGHTASLFPGADTLEIEDRAAAPALCPVDASWRVSLTYPVLNSARRVLFMVAGKAKATIISKLLQTDRVDAEKYPAGRIRPQEELIWCLDTEAAKLLL